MTIKVQTRHDTTSNWSSANPILLDGEIGVDITKDLIKVGDGTHTWASLEYAMLTTEAQTASGDKTFLAPVVLYKQGSAPASADNIGQIYETTELYHIDTKGLVAQLTLNGYPLKDLADARMTMVDTSTIKLSGIAGTSQLIYINGEFCDLTSIRTVNHIATMLSTDGTMTTSPTVGDTLLHVYASNSLVTSYPNEIRTSVFSSNANKYLGDSGDAQNWRLVGWIYPITVSGTSYFFDDQANRLVCSKWNPKETIVYVGLSATHTYKTSIWRKWNNADTTLTKYIIHEDYPNFDVCMLDYRVSSDRDYGRSAVSYDSVISMSNKLNTYYYSYYDLCAYFMSGGATFTSRAFGYHYSYGVEYGNANSQSYRYIYYQIILNQ